MPLYKTITVNEHTNVLIWKIEESEASLRHGVVLTQNCVDRIDSMKSEIHRRGFLSIRQLLKIAGYEPKELYYDTLGKPHLTDGKKISITHSFTYTAIIVSNNEVGIDIEMQREKILRIANKFTTFESYKTLANTEAIVRKLTIVWCAKEAIYKSYAIPGVSFLNHIDIQDFFMEDQRTSGIVLFRGNSTSYGIDFLEFDGFTCAYSQKG